MQECGCTKNTPHDISGIRWIRNIRGAHKCAPVSQICGPIDLWPNRNNGGWSCVVSLLGFSGGGGNNQPRGTTLHESSSSHTTTAFPSRTSWTIPGKYRAPQPGALARQLLPAAHCFSAAISLSAAALSSLSAQYAWTEYIPLRREMVDRFSPPVIHALMLSESLV